MSRFEPIRPLGRGAMGEVWLAHDREGGGEVALKRLAPEVGDAESTLRFAREAQALARVTHPAVVRLLAWGQEGGRPWLAMEHLPGGSLEERVRRRGPLPEAEVAALGAALAHGLEAAHAAGLLHRDVKPGNVLLDAAGAPRLVDFGLTRSLTPGGSLTATGAVLGTPAYMAPEQAQGDPRAVGPAADVWGLGATLYFLLTGEPPHAGRTPLEVLTALVTCDPPPPSTRRPGLDLGLERIVRRALARTPEARWPSAGALALALEGWTPAGAAGARRLPAAAVLAGVVLAAGVGLGGWLLAAPPPAPPPPAARPGPASPPPPPPDPAHRPAVAQALAQAEAALAREDAEEAARHATRALELEPDSAWALVLRGSAHLRQGAGELARLDAERALGLELDPRPDPARLAGRARLAMAFGRWEAAQADLERLAGQAPTAETAQAELARMREALAARRAGRPGPTQALLAEAEALARGGGEPGAVERSLRQAAWGVDGHAWELRHLLALLAEARGDLEGAARELRIALAIHPDDPGLIRALAGFHARLGRSLPELGEFARIAVALGTLGARQPADDDLDAFVRAHPDHLEALMMRSTRRMTQAVLAKQAPDRLELVETLAALDRALARDPAQGSANVQGSRADLLLLLGDLPRAREAIELAVALCPVDPFLRQRRGRLRARTGDPAGAREDLDWLEARAGAGPEANLARNLRKELERGPR